MVQDYKHLVECEGAIGPNTRYPTKPQNSPRNTCTQRNGSDNFVDANNGEAQSYDQAKVTERVKHNHNHNNDTSHNNIIHTTMDLNLMAVSFFRTTIL